MYFCSMTDIGSQTKLTPVSYLEVVLLVVECVTVNTVIDESFEF